VAAAARLQCRSPLFDRERDPVGDPAAAPSGRECSNGSSARRRATSSRAIVADLNFENDKWRGALSTRPSQSGSSEPRSAGRTAYGPGKSGGCEAGAAGSRTARVGTSAVAKTPVALDREGVVGADQGTMSTEIQIWRPRRPARSDRSCQGRCRDRERNDMREPLSRGRASGGGCSALRRQRAGRTELGVVVNRAHSRQGRARISWSCGRRSSLVTAGECA